MQEVIEFYVVIDINTLEFLGCGGTLETRLSDAEKFELYEQAEYAIKDFQTPYKIYRCEQTVKIVGRAREWVGGN